MEAIRIALFGRLTVHVGERAPVCFPTAREQEVLAYLLLHRARPQARESVASALWGGHCTTEQAKAYFRKALWQLQATLHAGAPAAADLIEAEARWVHIAPADALRLDVATLEDAFARVRDVPGQHLSEDAAGALHRAVDVYTGDLLEGWYHEWCLVERERLRQVYLLALDKLMVHAEATGRYEAGIAYGEAGLRADAARERTYYRLIRLRSALGDRTGALRLYARCVAALREELDATPAARTVELARAVREGTAPAPEGTAGPATAEAQAWMAEVAARLRRLVGLQRELATLQGRVAEEIEAIGAASKPEWDADA